MATVRDAIIQAVEAEDSFAFGRALNDAWRAGMPADLGPSLAAALVGTWHKEHEDIVNALQDLRDSATTKALLIAARMRVAYLDYDDGAGLARKCTWALADIGTAEARSALEDLAGGAEAEVAAYAQKRLDAWEREAGRKGRQRR